MAENWKAIATEVADAIKSIGSTDAGYPVTLRIPGTTSGPDYDPVIGPPTYHTLHCIESSHLVRDASGTLIEQTLRTLTVTAVAGVVPSDNHQVLVGQDLTYVDEATDAALPWVGIVRVRPLAPAGTAVLYELDLSS